MEQTGTETHAGLSDTGSQTDKWLSVEVIEPKIRKKRGRPPVRKYTNEVAGMVADAKQVGGTHYTSMPVQPWTAMQAWMTPQEFQGFLRGNVIKYMARAGTKPDVPAVQDLKKAMHYLEKLVEVSNA